MPYEFLAELTEIFRGAQAGPSRRWSACNFFDKVLLAQSSVVPQYWVGGDSARPIPGLPDGQGWDGVTALFGHPMLWRGEVIKYADKNDFTTWIPVARTATSARAAIAEKFTQPKPGQVTGWVHLNRADAAFTSGQFARIELEPEDPLAAVYNFYSVAEVADTLGMETTTIDVEQRIPASTTGRVYTKVHLAWPNGSRLIIGGQAKMLEVLGVSNPEALVLTSSAASGALPLPGQTFLVSVSTNPSKLKVGDVLSATSVGADLFEVRKVGFTLQLKRLNVGASRHAAGFVFPSGTNFVLQPHIEVKSSSSVTTVLRKASAITAQAAVTLRALALTGQSAEGATIPADAVLATLDANEAGEFVNAGANINGDIFGVAELGEYGVILKRQSIQSIQYVGRENGTFFTRPEISGQGPIARHAWDRFDTKSLVFVGESEIYQYSGGQTLDPIATRWTKEFFEELDRARADEIVVWHNRPKDQIWVVFPSLKTPNTRVLIYNYREQSSVVDDYGADVGGISALGSVDWEVAPTWRSLPDTLFWEDDTKRWREYVDEGLQKHTIIAVGGDLPTAPEAGEYGTTGVPRLLLHGRKFSRASRDNCHPAAYVCLAETQDHDFEDARRIKHVDTIVLDMEVKEKLLNRPMNLYVQFGARENLDSDIRWSAPGRVEVSGNGNHETKVNIRAYGRFVRVRFYSEETDVQWRVAGFALVARAGGTV